MKEWGNDAFKKKKYEMAEQFYSKALEKNLDSRSLWTNRSICRNNIRKHEDALIDCMSALSIDPKCSKEGFQIEALQCLWESTRCGSLRSIVQHQFESLFKSILQKGNAHFSLGQFDEAKECYESLRTLGENSTADKYLEKLNEAQERDKYFIFAR